MTPFLTMLDVKFDNFALRALLTLSVMMNVSIKQTCAKILLLFEFQQKALYLPICNEMGF